MGSNDSKLSRYSDVIQLGHRNGKKEMVEYMVQSTLYGVDIAIKKD